MRYRFVWACGYGVLPRESVIRCCHCSDLCNKLTITYSFHNRVKTLHLILLNTDLRCASVIGRRQKLM